MTKAI